MLPDQIATAVRHHWWLFLLRGIAGVAFWVPRSRKRDRKSTRLNSSHRCISYAVFCLLRPPPHLTLFPYTTLFRSLVIRPRGEADTRTRCPLTDPGPDRNSEPCFPIKSRPRYAITGGSFCCAASRAWRSGCRAAEREIGRAHV